MNTGHTKTVTVAPGPPPRLHLAIMIWIAVALSTLVVPLVVYLILPRLQEVRVAWVSRS